MSPYIIYTSLYKEHLDMPFFDEEIKIEHSKEHLVVKDNRLIQNVTRRKYELSVLEQKVLGFIISMIKPPQDTTDGPVYKYEFDVRLFCKVCGIDFNNGKNYANDLSRASVRDALF